VKKRVMPDITYRRNLPHVHPDGFPLFITFRLADSLPKEIILNLKEERERTLKSTADSFERYSIEEGYFERYDEYLDRCASGPRWLENHEVAKVVANKISDMDNLRYKLFAYCIMPNHVHLIIEPYQVQQLKHRGKSVNYPVTETMRLLKGSTARECNIALKRNGSFWQHESYDHFIRSEKEFERTIKYVLHNPVKAGSVQDWTDWKFTYVNPEFGEG
jgi:REP element-mobilizing transposase RayT